MKSQGENRKRGSASGLFSQDGELEDEYKRSLVQTSKKLEDSSVDKSPIVHILMQKAAPDGYNGVLIDIHEIVVSRLTPEAYQHLERSEKIKALADQSDQLFAKKIDELVRKAMSNGHQRLQIIVKSRNHYTPCDIDIEKRSIFVFDAAGDIRRACLHTMAQYCSTIDKDKVFDVRSDGFVVGNRVINGGAIQKSQQGCWVFSLRHSFYFASQPNLHEMLSHIAQRDKRDPVRKVSWFDLPPQVVMMAQSTSFFENYMALHPEYRSMMMTLTNNNESNYGFKLIYNETKEMLREICQKNSSEELREIVEGKEPNRIMRI